MVPAAKDTTRQATGKVYGHDPTGPEGRHARGEVQGRHRGNVAAGQVHQQRLEHLARALVSVVRDHKVVAHGDQGTWGAAPLLPHGEPLHGKYTLFVEIPGVTTSSQKIRIS